MLNLKNKNSIETIWAFSTKWLTLILFIWINIILARSLSVADFGLWSLFLSIITVICVLSYFGINNSSKKFVAQYNETENLENVLTSSLKLRIIFSALFSFLVFLVAKPLSIILWYPELTGLLLLGIPLVFLSGLVEYLKMVFMGLHKIKYNFIINTLEYSLKLILIIIFLFFSSHIHSVIQSFIIAMFITSSVGLYLLYFNFYKNLKKSDYNFTNDILKYSFPLLFISLGFIVLTEIDTMMIGMFSSIEEVGIYAVAKQIIINLPHIAIAITMGTMPIFAKLNKENKKKLNIKLFELLKIVLLIYIAIMIGILILSPLLIPLVFGNNYINSVLPLQILSFYSVLVGISVVLTAALDYTWRAKKRALNISFTIILNIMLNLILIPKYGAVGASVATTISFLPYIILNYIEILKTFK